MTPAPSTFDGREFSAARVAHLVAEQIASRPHAVVVELGHRAGPGDLAAIASSLGDRADTARDTLVPGVEVLVPAADRTIDGVALTERLHTDGADRLEPPRYTCLLCLQPDADGGGRSVLCDIAAFVAAAATIPGGTELIGSVLPWKLAAEDGGGIHPAAPVDATAGRVRWLDPGVAIDQQALPPNRWGAITAVARAVEAAARRCAADVLLGPGRLLVIDNTRCLHARTPVAEPDGSRRSIARARVH